MKISEKNIKACRDNEKLDAALFEDNFETFGIENATYDNDINNLQAAALERTNFLKSHPVAAAVAAAALIGAPIAGIGISGIAGQAAELGDNDSDTIDATYVENENAETVEETQEISKAITFSASGPGHIEPVENCTIDGETGTITFTDPTQNAKFKLVKDVEGASVEVKVGDTALEATDDIITLNAYDSYEGLTITYVDVLAEQRAAEEAAAAEAAAKEAAAQATAASSSSSNKSTSNSSKSTKSTKTTTTANTASTTASTASTAATTAAPAATTTTTAATTSTASYSNGMTSEELALAKEIFNAYNSFRASKGLSTVSWSDECASYAYNSATGCANAGTLTHRLGIPSAKQSSYSDILQYSSWKMSGSEVVNNWSNSSGHRKMMQCNSATQAAVAVYKSGNSYYYVIVYNFSGCNQSGS